MRGNVLFLILIAVALFAALSYAVTQSNKGGGDISKDKLRLTASQMIQYATHIEQAVTRLTVVNGCSDTQISFENPIEAGFVNPNAPADKRCHVFDENGGGISARKFPQELVVDGCAPWWCGIYNFTPGNSFQYVGTDGGAGGSSLDLAFSVYGVSEDLCREINKLLKLPNATTTMPSRGVYVQKFVGTYSYSDYPVTAWPSQRSGCFQWTTSTHHVFYHTLIAR